MLQILQEAMRRILGSHLILPPTIDLLAIFERQRPLGQKIDPTMHLQRAPQLQRAKQFSLKQRRLVEMEDTSKPNREVELSVAPSPWKDRTPGQEMHQGLRPQHLQSSNQLHNFNNLQSFNNLHHFNNRHSFNKLSNIHGKSKLRSKWKTPQYQAGT